MNHDRRHFLGTAATAIAATQLGGLGSVKAWVRQIKPAAVQLSVAGDLPSLAKRLYQLIRQPKPIADRLVEIEFLDARVEVFAFTFG
jgi:hypothetical protein